MLLPIISLVLLSVVCLSAVAWMFLQPDRATDFPVDAPDVIEPPNYTFDHRGLV